MKLLDAAAVARGLPYPTCIGLMREAMMSLSSGQSPKIARSSVPVNGHGILGLMPGILGDGQTVFGAKLISVFHDPETGRGRHRGVVVLFKGDDGEPVCVADAEEITKIRTASASAAATEALARRDANRLAVFGTGVQAYSHITALNACRTYEQVLIWDIKPEEAESFATRVSSDFGLDARAASAEEAASSSDVICTVTSAPDPILFGRWVKPGTHLNIVGSSVAGPAEIDSELVARSRFIVDSIPSALEQAGEFLRAKKAGLVDDDHIAGEIGEVHLGTLMGRRSDEEVTIYKSLGHIVQDLAATRYLFSKMG